MNHNPTIPTCDAVDLVGLQFIASITYVECLTSTPDLPEGLQTHLCSCQLCVSIGLILLKTLGYFIWSKQNSKSCIMVHIHSKIYSMSKDPFRWRPNVWIDYTQVARIAILLFATDIPNASPRLDLLNSKQWVQQSEPPGPSMKDGLLAAALGTCAGCIVTLTKPSEALCPLMKRIAHIGARFSLVVYCLVS